jgi:hypothetical protein
MCGFDGTGEFSINVEDPLDIKEEVSIKVEEAVDIKDEMPEVTVFPPFMTEHEVRLRGLCKVVAALAFGLFIAVHQKEIMKLHLTSACLVLCCGCHIAFEIWIVILKRRDFLLSHCH